MEKTTMGLVREAKMVVQVEETVWKGLSDEVKVEIGRVCGEKLDVYYGKFKP